MRWSSALRRWRFGALRVEMGMPTWAAHVIGVSRRYFATTAFPERRGGIGIAVAMDPIFPLAGTGISQFGIATCDCERVCPAVPGSWRSGVQ